MNRIYTRLSATIPQLFVATALIACTASPPPPAAVTPSASIGSTGIEPEVRIALANGARTDRERARDSARHPAETLAFFGLRSNATVVELFPGGGYYTAILAPLLADHGKLVVTQSDLNGDPKDEGTQDAKALAERVSKAKSVLGKVAFAPLSFPAISFGPDESADFVLTFRNVHNWEDGKGGAEAVFKAIARVLKHGGVLGVEEHRGAPGMTAKEIERTGYIPEARVVALAAEAGLELAGRGEMNANPKDTKDHPQGVWSLPPTLAGGDKDRAKFEAIGESDRMTLRFIKK